MHNALSVFVRRGAVLAALSLLFSLAACGGDDGGSSTSTGACRLNSDCPVGEVCEDGACVEGGACDGDVCYCASDDQCPEGQRCAVALGRCLLAECEEDSDCALGQVCEASLCLTDLAADRDRDGLPDLEDSCPDAPNAQDDDTDGDGRGDACDGDDDNDGVVDEADNCPQARNDDQHDANGDGLGNACDGEWRGVPVRGRVVAQGIDRPDLGALQIRLTGVEQPVAPAVDGTFAFNEALRREGSYTVTVLDPAGGFGVAVASFAFVPDAASLPEDGVVDLGDVRVTYQSSVRLEGQVMVEGAEGDASGVTVFVEDAAGNQVTTTLTDAEGRFTARVAPVDYVLGFSRRSFLTVRDVEARFIDVEQGFQIGDGTPVVMSLDDSAGLLGQLVDASGGEVDDWGSITEAWLVQGDGVVLGDVTRDGAVVFQNVVPGVYTLLIDARGYLMRQRPVELEANQTYALGDFPLTHESQSNAAVPLSGTFAFSVGVSSELSPLGTHVSVYRGDQLYATSITDAQGQFAVPASRDEIYTMTAQRAGLEVVGYAPGVRIGPLRWDEGDQRFELDGAPLEFMLENADFNGTISVRADLTATLVPPNQRQFQILLIGTSTQSSQIADFSAQTSVTRTFNNLPADTYLVSVRRPGFSTREQLVTLSEQSDNRTIRFTGDQALVLEDLAQAGLTLEGQIVTASDLRTLGTLRGANLSGAVIRADANGNNPADLSCLDLSSANLSGADLEGANLSGVDLRNATLRNANLSAANFQIRPVNGSCPDGRRDTLLNGAIFSAADLSGANFGPRDATPPRSSCDQPASPRVWLDGARLDQVNLSDAALAGVHLEGQELSGSVLRDAQLQSACLRGASMILTNLSDANLTLADLRGSQMTSSVLVRTVAWGADFDGASLAGAVIELAVLGCVGCGVTTMHETNLNGANLVGANLRGVQAEGASFLGAIMGDALVRPATISAACTTALQSGDWPCTPQTWATCTDDQLPRVCRVTHTSLNAAVLDGAEMVGVLFNNVDLTDASFDRTNLQASRFIDATFLRTSFRSATLTTASLVGEYLNFVDLTGADLTLADLRSTLITNTTLSDCTWQWQEACYPGPSNTPPPDITRCITPASCSRAVLQQANLQNADLNSSHLVGVILAGADLRNSRLNVNDMRGASIGGAELPNGGVISTNFSGARIAGSDLSGAVLSGAIMDDINIENATLEGVYFPGGILHGYVRGTNQAMNMRRSYLHSSDLTEIYMENVNLMGSSLFQVILRDAQLHACNVTQVDLSSANLFGMQPYDSVWTGSTFNSQTICRNGQSTAQVPRCGLY